MGKLLTIMRNAPKRTSMLVAVIAAAIIVPATLFAWGPSRPTYTIEHPADHVVFNSITNNPAHGDERNFVQVKEATASNSSYADSVSLTAGKEYTVFVYFHNNAATNLNASGKGIAKNVTAKVEVPALVKSKSNGTKAVGYINSSNASPASVWDDISFSNGSDGDIALRMVPGSAKLTNKGAANGATVADSIVTTGAPLGYDSLNGVVPGCNEFSGYVTFKLKADQANFTVSKQVRKTGTTTWSKSVEANPGDNVDYLIGYKNTGTTQQNDVVVKDTLPKGISYVNGSTTMKNALNPNGVKVSDNLTKASGINIANYTPGSNAYVYFTGKVASKDALECGTQKLVNKATVETNNGNKSDTADVVVKNGECKPNECKPGIPEGDVRCTPPTECKPGVPTGDTRCEEKCPIPGKENLPKDSAKCKETPVTPPELPHTGPTENVLAVIGLGSLIASAGYYINSRRSLLGR